MEAMCKRGGETKQTNRLKTNKVRKNLDLDRLPGGLDPEICLLNT